MKTMDLLIAARKRIENPENWTRGMLYGKRAEGGRVCMAPKLSEASCFCAIGAVAAEVGVPTPFNLGLSGTVYGADWLKETSEKNIRRAIKYLNAAAKSISAGWHSTAWGFNDSYLNSHEDVLKVYDLAIKRARRRHANGG